MAAYRHLKRIAVVQALFEWEFYGEEKKPEEALAYAYQETMSFARGKVKEVAGQKTEQEEFTPDEWTVGLLEGVMKNIKKIRKLVTKYAPEWPLEKIAPLDRAVLYLGVYELCFSEETPEIVVINEAVEIAKSFGNKNSSKFINGVLNSVFKSEPRKENKDADTK